MTLTLRLPGNGDGTRGVGKEVTDVVADMRGGADWMLADIVELERRGGDSDAGRCPPEA